MYRLPKRYILRKRLRKLHLPIKSGHKKIVKARFGI